MTTRTKPRRRWFQYSLRTLLVLVAVVAVWLALTANSARKQGAAVAVIETLGGEVSYEHESVSSPQEPPGPEWLRGLVGEEYFFTIIAVRFGNTQIDDSGLEHLKGLKSLILLGLYSTHVNDEGLEHLKGLTSLQWLDLDSTNVTDAGLEHLKGLSQLQGLFLNDTNVTDEGVKKLQKALPNCEIYR